MNRFRYLRPNQGISITLNIAAIMIMVAICVRQNLREINNIGRP